MGTWKGAARNGPARAFAVAFAALSLVTGFAAQAQPAAYTAKCNTCHLTPPSGGRVNGADAGALILSVIANGATNGTAMNGITFAGTELTDITDYLEAVFDTTPMTASPAFQAATTVSLATKVLLGTAATGLNVLESTAPPGKGSVSYNTGAPSFTYTAGACQTGADTFFYHARNSTSGVTTSSRRVDVTIANPAAGPTFTSATTASGQTGVAFTYASAVSACPSIVAWSLPSAPPWLTVDAAGIVSGTPPFGTQGTAPTFTVRGTFPGGAFTDRTVTLSIALGAPVVTSAATAPAGAVAVAYAGYQITATNGPPFTAFGATGLPPGLTVNTTTGLISGTPTLAGNYTASVTASNATGPSAPFNVSFSIVLNVPVVNSAAAASGQTGVPFSYQITATNGPLTGFTAAPLPPGLALGASGLISGTPTANGTTSVTVTASNVFGPSNPFTLVITIGLGPPVITSASSAGAGVGTPFTFQIVATNSPASYGASGLPPGLSINTTSGLISGTPTATGTFPVAISATNATATTNGTLTISVLAGVPAITSPTTASGQLGQAFSYQITATNSPTSFNAAGLPAGLSVNTATGVISGTPAASGSFSVTLSATNVVGTSTLVLNLSISLPAPVITSPATASGTTGAPFSYQITAGNNPTSFGATPLPPGLAVDASTGLISGTPTAGGTFSVTVSATNATGTVSQVVAISIAFVAPAVRDLTVDVPFETATVIVLPVSGQFTQVNIVTRPGQGTVSTPAAGSATVTYTPGTGYSGSDTFTYSATGPGGTSPTATVTITVPTFRPVVRAASLTVPLNTPTALDLRPFIRGSGVTGVSIASLPAHGLADVNGTTVTYTPRTDYFGTDSFTYVAYGNAGTSEPGVVNVTITGRPDPSRDANVVGLLEAQAQAARRFSRAQLSNYQRRLETLHVGPVPVDPETEKAPASGSISAPVTQAQAGRDVPSGTAGAGAAAAPSGPAGAAGAPAGFVKTALASTLVSAATSHSLNVAASSDGTGGGSSGTNAGTNVWIGGVANFGRRSLADEGGNLKFSTDGLSVGADRRFSDQLALGLGLGYARDRTDIGNDGSRSKSDGASFAGYGSYHPTRDTFIDGVLGFGRLDMSSDRYVASIEEFATGRRKGTQVFGSLAAGYEMRREGVLFSPYGRVDFSVDKLRQATESGAGLNALTYNDQTLRSAQVAAGLRLETQHRTDFGWAMPRLRVEARHDFDGGRTATLSYADLYGGLTYSVTPSGSSRNSLLLGVGGDFLFRGGLRIGVDYQGERTSGAGTSQAVRVLFSQDLDGKGLPPWPWEWNLLTDPVGLEAGYVFDDNASRGLVSAERISDQVYTLGLNASRTFPINDNARAIATGLLEVDKFHEYTGLGRTSGGLQGELQYRGSGDFDATTFTLFARGWLDGYESRLRSGHRFSVGANARRSLTDRIDVFGEIGANWRYAQSAVFEGRDYAAKFNVDYSLGSRGTLYLAGEYRRGDTFSSGFATLTNLGLAEVFVRDDAFDTLPFYAYRLEARSLIGTLGYNRPLGPRDSLDFSWRRVRATPLQNLENAGSLRYDVNQYSILYLMRF